MKADQRKNWLIFSSVILITGLAWIWLSRTTPEQTFSDGLPAPRQGFMAPDFSLTDATGKTIRLSDLRGRPVLVNVWASWCTPCRAEMPAMQRLYQEYQQRGLEILAVNSTSQDNRDNAQSFADQLGLTFPILYDDLGDVAKLYQVQSLPSSFFIDAAGKVHQVVIGGPMAEALLRVRIEQLFEQITPQPGASN